MSLLLRTASPQRGSLILQRKSFKVHGAWTPYWQYDAICLKAGLADEIAAAFRVALIDVEWHATSPGKARQIVAPTVGERWFDADQLRARVIAQHGTPGAACAECGVWRWLPHAATGASARTMASREERALARHRAP